MAPWAGYRRVPEPQLPKEGKWWALPVDTGLDSGCRSGCPFPAAWEGRGQGYHQGGAQTQTLTLGSLAQRSQGSLPLQGTPSGTYGSSGLGACAQAVLPELVLATEVGVGPDTPQPVGGPRGLGGRRRLSGLGPTSGPLCLLSLGQRQPAEVTAREQPEGEWRGGGEAGALVGGLGHATATALAGSAPAPGGRWDVRRAMSLWQLPCNV